MRKRTLHWIQHLMEL